MSLFPLRALYDALEQLTREGNSAHKDPSFAAKTRNVTHLVIQHHLLVLVIFIHHLIHAVTAPFAAQMP